MPALCSITNAQAMSGKIVVRYAGKRRFLDRPKSYEELETMLSENFPDTDPRSQSLAFSAKIDSSDKPAVRLTKDNWSTFAPRIRILRAELPTSNKPAPKPKPRTVPSGATVEPEPSIQQRNEAIAKPGQIAESGSQNQSKGTQATLAQFFLSRRPSNQSSLSSSHSHAAPAPAEVKLSKVVVTIDNAERPLSVPSQTTLAELSQMMALSHGYAPDKLYFMYNGLPMNPLATVEMLQLPEGAKLTACRSISVTIIPSTGVATTITVYDALLIYHLRETYARVSGVHPAYFVLVHKGQMLADDRTLASYGLKDGDALGLAWVQPAAYAPMPQ